MLTVDANVWVADQQTTEPDHMESREFLDALEGGALRVHLPWLAVAEVAGAVARKTRDASLALRVGIKLRTVPLLEFHGLDEALANDASALAARCFLRGSDAVYAALAKLTGSALITLDAELRHCYL